MHTLRMLITVHKHNTMNAFVCDVERPAESITAAPVAAAAADLDRRDVSLAAPNANSIFGRQHIFI